MKKKYFYLFVILTFFNAHSQEIISFADPNFKAALINPSSTSGYVRDQNGVDISIDSNNDGEIDRNEALAAYQIELDFSANVSSLTDIQYFTNLEAFLCIENPIAEINISPLVNLKTLVLVHIPITTIDISLNPQLINLVLQYNRITNLDVSPLTALNKLDIRFNGNLENLIMDDHPLLTQLVLAASNIREVNLNRYPELELVGLEYNQLTSIDVSNLHKLKVLYCNSNQITNLDASHSPYLQTLYCADNPFLESINVKAGLLFNPYQLDMTISNLPMLRYICADDNYIQQAEAAIVRYGLTNCHVNSYCSFVPGGEFYTIEGHNRFNTVGTECDANAMAYPNLKFSITDGTTTGTLFANPSGNYNVAVQEGIHTLTPLPENNYFTVFPTTTTATFPATASPFVQDFCLSPNGTHNDLEVVVVPIIDARPGFDSDYKVIYTNKGTAVASGSLSFEYNPELGDLIATNPVASVTTSNTIIWNFTDLQPFESRFVSVKLNHNSPVESPALNDGDQLLFNAKLSTTVVDETPGNNEFQLSQVVVNSLDPNDKTCLEGINLSPEIAGKFVHYMIRFENTGSASAVNVVVKDLIDVAKFDISTLIPVNGSHNYITKISEGNKVEFIFENIQLPFDDANNDGYVVFKIKTKPAILNDNMFSNTANIYFDYNAPIITNTATTTLTQLAVKDFKPADNIFIYPNPVNDILTIGTKTPTTIYSISIHNLLGQLLQVKPNAQNTKSLEVSNLKTGQYLVKLSTNHGTVFTKFIKN